MEVGTENKATPAPRKRAVATAIVISIPLFFLFTWLTMFWQLTQINDSGLYWNVKNLRWLRQDLIKHFPESLPSSAEAARLHYHAGFLQGGSHIELRFRADTEFINKVRAYYTPPAVDTITAGQLQAVSSDSSEAVSRKRYFYTASTESDSGLQQMLLPEDFEIFVITNNDGNHGDSSGFAISDTRHEVIFWAEKW